MFSFDNNLFFLIMDRLMDCFFDLLFPDPPRPPEPPADPSEVARFEYEMYCRKHRTTDIYD